MEPWTAVARSFPPAPRSPGIASDALPPPPSPGIRSMAGLESPAPAHRALGAGGDRSPHIQTLCERACAAPIASRSCPLRPARADIPDTPATLESPSILCASTAECTEKRHLNESSIFECFQDPEKQTVWRRILRQIGSLFEQGERAV